MPPIFINFFIYLCSENRARWSRAVLLYSPAMYLLRSASSGSRHPRAGAGACRCSASCYMGVSSVHPQQAGAGFSITTSKSVFPRPRGQAFLPWVWRRQNWMS